MPQPDPSRQPTVTPEPPPAREKRPHDWLRFLDYLKVVSPILALLAYLGRWNLPEWVLFLLVMTFLSAPYDWIRRGVRWQTKPSFPRCEVFRGLYASGEVTAGGKFFRRVHEIERLKELVLAPGPEGRILAVTGTSGAGKSVLIDLFKQELLKGDPPPVVCLERFNSADKASTVLRHLVEQVEAGAGALQEAQGNARMVLILDQFEVCLDRVIDTYLTDRKVKRSLREVLEPAADDPGPTVEALRELLPMVKRYPGLRIVVVLRSDRYYDLRLLGKLGQIPYDAFEVMGIAEDSGLRSLKEMLLDVGFAEADLPSLIDHLRDADGTILPVKAQLIGCMLERKSMYLEPAWLGRLFGKTEKRLSAPWRKWTFEQLKRAELGGGVIEQYFRQVIQSSPREDVAAELLFVMGIEGRVKTRYTLADLAAITFRDKADIDLALDDLIEGGLVANAHGELAFAHDYLAQQYNLLSGRLIDPVVRDNLAYSHTTFTQRKRSTGDGEPERTARRKVSLLLQVIKLGLLGFFAVRLIRFDWLPLARMHQWAPSFAPYEVKPQWALDWHYLPIAIVQCCWAVYVIDLVANVFLQVDNRPAMRWGSAFMVGMVVIGMVWTAFMPGTWLVWLGVNGVLVGLKFGFMGREIARCTSGRNRYSIIGLYTIINSVFVMYVGWVVYPHVVWDLARNQGRGAAELIVSLLAIAPAIHFLYVYYAVIPLLVYFIYMYRAHVIPSRAVEFIGLYKRVEAVE